jgi:hypothetical protein
MISAIYVFQFAEVLQLATCAAEAVQTVHTQSESALGPAAVELTAILTCAVKTPSLQRTHKWVHAIIAWGGSVR